MRVVCISLLVFLPLLCRAQKTTAETCSSNNKTKAEKTWLAGIGHAAILDTYLSQEHYSGIEVNLFHEMTKPLKKDTLRTRTHTYQVEFSRTKPRSDAETDYTAMFDYSFGMHRRFPVTRNLTIAIGGQGNFFLGGIYNTRGGNNPAQLKLGIDIAPSVRAAYRFALFHKTMRLNYCIDIPLIGLQFSPAYGQSYYEIFSLGNYDHNLCCSSVFNAVSLAHRLTLDIFFHNTALTLGYLGNCRQSELNNLKYHSYSHSFVIGVTL